MLQAFQTRYLALHTALPNGTRTVEHVRSKRFEKLPRPGKLVAESVAATVLVLFLLILRTKYKLVRAVPKLKVLILNAARCFLLFSLPRGVCLLGKINGKEGLHGKLL